MSEPLDTYLHAIRSYAPQLAITTAQLNTDGMVNAVVIVNDELVFRFPLTQRARTLQQYEATLLAAIGPLVPVPIPQVEMQTEQFALYRFLPGEPLYLHTLLAASQAEQARVLGQLAAFLAALHVIPLAQLPVAPWAASGSTTSARERALVRMEAVQQRLYPYLWRDQRAWVEHLHSGVLDGTLDLDAFRPRLVHADLASYHLLIDPVRWTLSGVLDFGTAGTGDPAIDIALLLSTYGERVVRRIEESYRIDPATLDRARFRAGALELEWALAGLDGNDPSMYFVHLGRARDLLTQRTG